MLLSRFFTCEITIAYIPGLVVFTLGKDYLHLLCLCHEDSVYDLAHQPHQVPLVIYKSLYMSSENTDQN